MQKQEVVVAYPKLAGCNPDWFNQHGWYMGLKEFDPNKRKLVISGSAATLTIRKSEGVIGTDEGWCVEWNIVYFYPYEEKARGRRLFSSDDLAAAFGLTSTSGDYGQWLIERYGGQSAQQGLYIRWQNYLNIPGPGTGHDGDPNISIKIEPPIREAVRLLLS